MSCLALNLFNLTLKRYNFIYASAFENLVIQTSVLGIASHANVLRGSSRKERLRDELLRTFAWEAILGSVSAKHPSKHCSFRQDPMRLPLIPKSQWKCRNLFWYSTSVKKGIANQKNRLNFKMSSRRCLADQKAWRLGFKERTPRDVPKVVDKVLYIVRRINLDIRYFKQLTTNQTKKRGVQWLDASMFIVGHWQKKFIGKYNVSKVQCFIDCKFDYVFFISNST